MGFQASGRGRMPASVDTSLYGERLSGQESYGTERNPGFASRRARGGGGGRVCLNAGRAPFACSRAHMLSPTSLVMLRPLGRRYIKGSYAVSLKTHTRFELVAKLLQNP